MKATCRGSLVVGTARIAHLDEDEATLAVAAARAALARAGAAVQRIEVEGNAVPGWVAHCVLALGLRGIEVRAVPSAAPAAPVPTLRIRSEAGRGVGKEALAVATLFGVAGPPFEVDASPAAQAVDAAFVARLVEAELQAPTQVPMGAYVPRATWEASLEARYRLLVSTCDTCKASAHPPFATCPRCGNPTRTKAHAGGTVYTTTSIAKGAGPTEFDAWQALAGDYGVAVVELDEGVRVAAMLDHATREPPIGSRVHAVFRRLYAQEGAWRYGVKLRAGPGER